MLPGGRPPDGRITGGRARRRSPWSAPGRAHRLALGQVAVGEVSDASIASSCGRSRARCRSEQAAQVGVTNKRLTAGWDARYLLEVITGYDAIALGIDANCDRDYPAVWYAATQWRVSRRRSPQVRPRD